MGLERLSEIKESNKVKQISPFQMCALVTNRLNLTSGSLAFVELAQR